MKIPSFFYCLLVPFLPLFGQTQDQCECAEELRLRPRIIQFFNAGKVDSAVLEFEKIRSVGTAACRISYCNSMAQYYFNKNDIRQVSSLMQEEKRLLDSVQCAHKAYARYFNTYGNYFLNQNQYQKSADYFLKALRHGEMAKYVFAQQRALTSLSVIFSQTEQHEKSLVYQKQAETLARKIKNKDELGIVLSRQGATYNSLYEQNHDKKYLDSAYLAAKAGLFLGRKLGNVHTQIDAYLGLATQALYNRQFNQTLRLADSVLQLLPKDLHHLYRYQALRLKSQALQELRQTQQAALYADSAQMEAQLFNPQMQINALKQVYAIQKSLGHHKQALMAYEKMSKLKDSLSTLAQFNAINELEQRYQGIKKEKSIQELTQSRKITLLHNQLLLLAIAAAFLVIFSLVFLLRQRTLQARQVTLEKEQRLNRARMNPHFFFNALVALQVLAMRTNDGRSIALYLSKFASIMRQILESTYLEYVSLAQEKAFLEKYLELQRLRFPATFEYSISVAEGLDSEHMMLPPMLIQPIAENAIEHGFRQNDRQNVLQIRFMATKDQQLILEVEDNGQGLDQQLEQKKNHLSRASQIIQDTLSILRQRHRCNAHFTLANKPGGGVIAQIFLPLIVKAG
ncbi:MAG: histidine kinase [Haliscomenobacter sp.]|uniref:sensor histidine kinase n=1 Tax=Haliscomenobacter sp. TaxID=2717303 RepID=UPI0029AE5248|nr:histidine kinase [Haliscomenobacter sp.]MDX2066962.1 histidine kinase [Haliscomenobacter sp.]